MTLQVSSTSVPSVYIQSGFIDRRSHQQFTARSLFSCLQNKIPSGFQEKETFSGVFSVLLRSICFLSLFFLLSSRIRKTMAAKSAAETAREVWLEFTSLWRAVLFVCCFSMEQVIRETIRRLDLLLTEECNEAGQKKKIIICINIGRD